MGLILLGSSLEGIEHWLNIKAKDKEFLLKKRSHSMPRGVVDVDGIQSPEMQSLKNNKTNQRLGRLKYRLERLWLTPIIRSLIGTRLSMYFIACKISNWFFSSYLKIM